MSFNLTPYVTTDDGDRPYKFTQGTGSLLHPLQPEVTTAADSSQYHKEHQKINTDHVHMVHEDRQPTGGDSLSHSHQQYGGVQFPSQCSYQYPADKRPLYPVYHPWQASLFSRPQGTTTSTSAEQTGFNYGAGNFAKFNIHERTVEPTCTEPLISPLDVYNETGSHSSSTSGSPCMSSTEPPISSHSSSGYGSSSGSTSSSPFPSPSLPDPAPPKKLETDSLAVTPTGDCSTVKPKKARTSYTAAQIHSLETAFEENAYPDYDKLEELAKTLGVTERKVKIWFQNKRARWRKKHAAEPVYNPDMYSAPTPVTSKFPAPAPTRFHANAPSGYSEPAKPYSGHTKYPTPTNYPMPSQYQRSGSLSGLYPPYTSAMYPSHSSVPPFGRPNISSDASPTMPGYPRAKTTSSSTIGYLPSSMSELSGEPSMYGASPYSQHQYPVTQMFSLR